MKDEDDYSRPTAMQLRTVARVLADDPSMRGTRKEYRLWFPDPKCRFEPEDHELFQYWYRMYGLASVRTDRGRNFVHWKVPPVRRPVDNDRDAW